jgi:hypothetical protein
MSAFQAFRCCRSPDAPYRYALTSPNSRLIAGAGDSIGEVWLETVPVLADAFHEAAHAAVALALGASIIGLKSVGQPIVWMTDAALPPIARAAVSIAGPVGERWHRRHVHVDGDAMLAGYVERSAFGGSCDKCKSIREIREAAPDVTDGDLFALYRQVEAATVELVRRPAIWRAIEEIANAAMRHGSLLGDEIEQIAVQHFRPGSYRLEIVGYNVEIREERP